MKPAAVAWLGLGSNLEAPAWQLRTAVDTVAARPGIDLLAVSAFYRSAAVGGPTGQPDFCNACIAIRFRTRALDLLTALQSIERAQGRVRDIRWGPRTLDLDILAIDHGYTLVHTHDPRLSLPHPRIVERAFVVWPLADIAPALPIGARRVIDWRRTVDDCDISRWPSP